MSETTVESCRFETAHGESCVLQLGHEGKHEVYVEDERSLEAELQQARDRLNALEVEVARWRELALEFVHNRHGYCRDCGEFTGYDRVQEIQGDTPHDDDCYVGRKLAAYDQARRGE